MYFSFEKYLLLILIRYLFILFIFKTIIYLKNKKNE